MAVYFNGAGSQRLDTISSFTPPSVGTVMYWKNSETGALRILGTDTLWESRISGANVLHEYRQSSQPSFANTDGVIQHWAFTYDGHEKYIFLDGVQVAGGAFAHGIGGASILSIGSSYWNPSQSFKGWLEDARIYNRILTNDEIQTVYAAQGVDGIVDGLLHRWMLTEGAEGDAVVQAKDVIGGLHANPVGTGVSEYRAGIIRTSRKQK